MSSRVQAKQHPCMTMGNTSRLRAKKPLRTVGLDLEADHKLTRHVEMVELMKTGVKSSTAGARMEEAGLRQTMVEGEEVESDDVADGRIQVIGLEDIFSGRPHINLMISF